ncbi:BLUF domain-containing protein [Oceanobacter mangrovi]|uniref:BLUF domain-containing protein n=1 Tax=Oceanobacter mangrovi TaxID=2862510 RepID=UPI001C8D830B|nr:BLUF domain-containing protein [Oceanobacter mangrovi]
MSNLIRLVYASKSNSVGRAAIDPAIGSILSQSRRNNSRDHIGGVLFYGDGFFFQCLEGERELVQATYARIQQDSRHSHARILRMHGIQERLFSDWSMKYVSAEQEVKTFLQERNVEVFNPFRFQEALIDELMLFFCQASPASIATTAQLDLTAQPVNKQTGLWGKLGKVLGINHDA